MKQITLLLFFFWSIALFSQVGVMEDASQTHKEFQIKGSVTLKEGDVPLSGVQVSVLGSANTQTTLSGDFRITAKVGDEIIITHPDIETVHYVVKNPRDNIKVIVENTKKQAKSPVYQSFNNLVENATASYKKNASKGISQITKALLIPNISKKERAKAYQVLGDMHMHWKQYDLAISSYNSSLKYQKNIQTQLKLAKSYLKNNKLEQAISVYKSIKKSALSPLQLVMLYENLGDLYTQSKNYTLSHQNYENGLKTAQKHQLNAKITDLNSKLGKVSYAQGKIATANTYFNNSLNLASEENQQRATIEKERVADFYNSNREFDKEIELRKKNLSALKTLDKEVIIENNFAEKDSITSQKTNYKIASAYIQQSKYKKAIPYLKESISIANKNNDLIIEKDATRKLSELYKASGNNLEALKNYQNYVNLVDKLYLKKEQEIFQSKKFSRDLAKHLIRISSLENEQKLAENKLLLVAKDKQLIAENNSKQRLLIYGLLLAMLLLSILAFYMYRSNKQQKLNNNLLALRSLRSQMNPHFIFNALNSVNTFIATNDERTANRYLTDFSKLMRSVLENSEQDFIPLEKEIELIQHYTKLEHFRFQDKFDYTLTVDENIDISAFMIPPMLLQPYVENAVWHGLRYKKEKGHLDISLQKIDDETIKISIIDDGIGREKSKELKTKNQQKHQSKGLGNIKKRIAILNEMYQNKITVAITDIENYGGTKVVLTLKKDH